MLVGGFPTGLAPFGRIIFIACLLTFGAKLQGSLTSGIYSSNVRSILLSEAAGDFLLTFNSTPNSRRHGGNTTASLSCDWQEKSGPDETSHHSTPYDEDSIKHNLQYCLWPIRIAHGFADGVRWIPDNGTSTALTHFAECWHQAQRPRLRA